MGNAYYINNALPARVENIYRNVVNSNALWALLRERVHYELNVYLRSQIWKSGKLRI